VLYADFDFVIYTNAFPLPVILLAS
jgi:hypothetical protein